MNQPPRFTSARERRLWLGALAVVAAIYATLGLASTLAAMVRARGVGEPLFVLGALLVLLMLLTQGLATWPGRAEVVVGLGIAASYLLLFVRMTIPTERTHLIEYGVVALLLHQALLERRRNGRTVRAPALVAVVATALLGWVDEGIQALLPNRVYDIRDVGFNALAGLMAVVASVALSWARQRGRHIPRSREEPRTGWRRGG